jgi:hypothetical protein
MDARNLEVDYTSATTKTTKYIWTCGDTGEEEEEKKNKKKKEKEDEEEEEEED